MFAVKGTFSRRRRDISWRIRQFHSIVVDKVVLSFVDDRLFG